MAAPGSAGEVGEALWQRLWAGGITDPPTAIEQISYLILLRTLDLRMASSPAGPAARAFADHHPDLRWERLKAMPDEKALNLLREQLIPFLVAAVESDHFTAAMRGASLAVPKANLVGDCIEVIDRLDLARSDQAPAQIYDDMLDQLLLSGGLSAQIRTPRSLVEAMVDLADPEPDQVVCDPAAGTCTFLVEANRRLQGNSGGLLGYDLNASMVRLGLINMIMHGIPDPKVTCTDTLSRVFEWPAVDIVIAHPPFAGNLDRRDVHPGLELTTVRTDVLFLELCRRLLRARGRAVVLVPEGVLFGRSRAYVEARRRWLSQGKVEAVISLPPQLLDPNSSVKTAILLLTASERTEQVWFGQIENEWGRTDDDADADGEPRADLRHLAGAVKWRLGTNPRPTQRAMALGRRMWSASIDEIGEQGWSLSPSTYRQFEESASEDEDPLELLDQAEALEIGVQQEMAHARALLENRL